MVSLLSAVIVCVIAWIGGFDFNERGGPAALVTISALFVFGWIYFCPIWWNK